MLLPLLLLFMVLLLVVFVAIVVAYDVDAMVCVGGDYPPFCHNNINKCVSNFKAAARIKKRGRNSRATTYQTRGVRMGRLDPTERASPLPRFFFFLSSNMKLQHKKWAQIGMDTIVEQ